MKLKLFILSFILSILNLLFIPFFLICIVSEINFLQEFAMEIIFYYPLSLILGCTLSGISFSKFRKEKEGKKWIIYFSLIVSWLFTISVILFLIWGFYSLVTWDNGFL